MSNAASRSSGWRVDDLQLDRVPRRPVGRPDEAALAGGRHAVELPVGAEGEVDQLEVVDGDVGAGLRPAIHSANWPPLIDFGSSSEQ